MDIELEKEQSREIEDIKARVRAGVSASELLQIRKRLDELKEIYTKELRRIRRKKMGMVCLEGGL